MIASGKKKQVSSKDKELEIRERQHKSNYVYLNIIFDQELVVLHTIPSRFGKFAVHAWRW